MEKLYDNDSYIKSFTAKVVSCRKAEAGFEIILDRTAFFPEQGGQTGDRGLIGDAEVLDTQIKDGIIYHLTDKELNEGEEFLCALDWEDRFRKMQNHTAEHIFSGIANKMYGCENTGFHLDNSVTLDFDILLNQEQIDILELEVNKTIWANKKVSCYYPCDTELQNINYRSKKEVYEGKTRIVEIEDTDTCACCAPHVNYTGEIGIMKVISFMKHKGGTRIFIVAGLDAFNDYKEKFRNTKVISNLLSVPQNEVSDGVTKFLQELTIAKKTIEDKNNIIVQNLIDNTEYSKENIVIKTDNLNSYSLINLINKGKEKTDKMFVILMGEDLSFRYAIGSKTINLREKAKEINSALSGKGGGSAEMIQGTFNTDFNTIEKYFKKG